LTLCNTSPFLTGSVQLIFSFLLYYHTPIFPYLSFFKKQVAEMVVFYSNGSVCVSPVSNSESAGPFWRYFVRTLWHWRKP
jgi:hypothetical protein